MYALFNFPILNNAPLNDKILQKGEECEMLIQCPECGKEISDKADACPNCGCPSSQWKQEPVEERKVKARQCSRCQKVFSPKLGACPECGYGWFAEIDVPESEAGFPVGPDGTPVPPPQSQEVKSKGGLTFWGVVGAIIVAVLILQFG